jgi:CubicO group peptidase (beta-lactamase class C family)
MQKSLWIRGLVVGIILLFVGTSFDPIINAEIKNFNIKSNDTTNTRSIKQTFSGSPPLEEWNRTFRGLTIKDTPNVNEIIFDIKIRSLMKIAMLPSLVACVIANNSVVWSGAYGFSDVYLRKKATLDSIYLIGSISKTITAMALMQLYEKRKFDLDDNISKFLPFDIKNPNYPTVNITFRMILSHQSSLGDTYYDWINFLPLLDNRTQWIKERLIPGQEKYRKQYWKDYPPGKNFSYSSIGFIIAALLVERISGISFEDYCQQNIFDPLCMHNTSFCRKNLDKCKIARPYFHEFRIYIPFIDYDAKCADACGGLRTTEDDLSHFLIVEMNKGVWKGVRIINESTIDLMHSIQYQNSGSSSSFYGRSTKWGLGWIFINLSGDMWEGYEGGAPGYICHMMIHDSSNTGVIMLSNGHFNRASLGKISQEYVKIILDCYVKIAYVLLQKANNKK